MLLSNETEVQVRYNEVDQMGVVHHSVYYVWLEVARFEFARRVFRFTNNDLLENKLEVPVVEAYVRYLQSARFGDRILIQTFAETSETSMLNLFYRILRADDHLLLAEGRTRHVFTAPGGRLMLRLPSIIAQRIEAAKQEHPHYFLEKPLHIDERKRDDE